MNVLTKFNRVTPLLIIVLLSLECCNSRNQSIDQERTNSVPPQPFSHEDSLRNKWKADDRFNDSLGIELLKKYPTSLNMDTIQNSFTIFFQNLLEKSTNLIYVKEAFIEDIEKQNGNLIISVYSYYPSMVGRYRTDSLLAKQLVSNLKMDDTFISCCYIANVKGFIPVHTELVTQIDKFSLTPEDPENNVITENDISDYVHLNLDDSSLPFYFIKGELIDFYILK
jgi:hypothetical protein